MSDGREEREELEKRRQLEEWSTRQDRLQDLLEPEPEDPWEPERNES